MMKRDAIPPIGGPRMGSKNPPMKPETIQHQIKKLKDSYDLAVLRMNEFSNMYNNNASNANMYVKVHGQKASKVYSALSSLIYASIAIAKVEGLEDFVKQNSVSLPSSMIDLEEWEHILNLAKDCREHLILKSLASNPISSRKLEQILPKQVVSQDTRKKMQLLEFLAINPLRNTRDEVVLLRQGMIDELNAYQGDFTQAMNLIYFVVKKLRDMQNADLNAQRVFSLKQQIQELSQTLDNTKKESEETAQQQKDSYEQIIAEMTGNHNVTVQSMKEAHEHEVSAMKAAYEKEISLLKTAHNNEMETKNSLISSQESTIASLNASLNKALKSNKMLETENNDLRNQLMEMTDKYNDAVAFGTKMDKDYQRELARMHAQYISDQTVDRVVFKTVSQVSETDVQTLANIRDNLQSMIDTLEDEKVKHLSKIAEDADSMDKFKKSIIALEQCKKELEDERLDLIAKKTDLESKKSTLELEKANLLVHQAELEGVKAVLEVEKAGLLNVKSELESQRTQLQSEKSELLSSKSALEGEKSELLVLKTKLEATIQELQHSQAQVQSSLQDLKQVHGKLQEDFDRVSSSHENLGKSHNILVENLSDVQKAKTELEGTKFGLEKTIEDLLKAKSELELRAKHAEEKSLADAQKAEQLRELMTHAKEESENSKRQAAEVQEGSARFKQGYDKVVFELQAVIEDLRSEKQQLLDVKAALECSIKELKASLDQVEKTLADLRQVNAKLQNDYNDLNKTNDALKGDNARLLQNISDVENAKKELEETKAGLESTIASLLATQADLEAQVKAADERALEEANKAEKYQEQMRRAKEDSEDSKRKAHEVHEDSTRFKKGYDKVVFELQAVIEELRERIKTEKAELGSAQALLDAKQATIAAHLAKLDYQQAAIEAHKQTNDSQKAKIDLLKTEVDCCKEEIESKKQQIANLHATIDSQQKEIDQYKKMVDAKSSEISQQKSTIDSQNSQIDHCKSQIIDLQSEVESGKMTIDSGKSEIAKLKEIIEDQKQQIQNYKAMVEAQNAEIAGYKSQVSLLKGSVDTVNAMIDANKGSIDSLKATIDSQNSEIDKCKSRIMSLEADVDSGRISLDENKTEINRLKSIIDQQEREIENYKAMIAAQNLEIEGYKAQVGSLTVTIDAQTKEMAEQKSQMSQHISTVDSQKAEINRLKTVVVDQQKDIDKFRSMIESQNVEIDGYKGQLEALRTTIAAGAALSDNNKAEIERLNQVIDTHNQKIAEYLSKIETLNSNVDACNDKIHQLTIGNNVAATLQSEVETLKSSIETQNQEITDLKSIVATNTSLIHEYKATIDSLKKDLVAAKSSSDEEKSRQSAEKHNLEESINLLNKTLHEKEGIIADLKSTVATDSSLIQEYKSTIDSLKQAMAEVKSTYDANKLAEVKKLEEAIADLSNALKEKEIIISDLKSTIAANSSAIEEYKSAIDSLHQDAARAKSSEGGDKAQKSAKSKKLPEDKIHQDLDLTDKKDEMEQSKQKVDEKPSAHDEEIGQLKSLLDTLRADLAKESSNSHKLSEDISELEKKVVEKEDEIERLKKLETQLKLKESDMIQLEEHLTALQGKQESRREAEVKPELWINDQAEQLQKVINSLKDENVSLQSENSALHETLHQLEKYLETLDSQGSIVSTTEQDQQITTPEITIPTELFNQTEKQLVDLVKRVEAEKVYSSKLHALLQVAERELKELQDKLLKDDEPSNESKSGNAGDAEVIMPADLRFALEEKIVELTKSLEEKIRECEHTLLLKNEQEHLASILRQEVDKQTEEIIALKTKVQESTEKKKNVGFTNDLQVFSIRDNDPVVEAKEVDDREEDKSSDFTGGAKSTVSRGPSVLEIDAQLSPRPETGSFKANFSPRSAAHYEAQRAVLQIIKSGVDEIVMTYDAPTAADHEMQAMPELSPKQKPEVHTQVKQEEAKREQQSELKQVEQADEVKKAEPSKPSAMAKVVSQYMYAVRIQSMVRAFLARHRIRRAKLEEMAQASGVLIACEGTTQGKTGWYRVQDQMFYFCVDEKEFVLLCGPISKELYDIAVEEINQIISKASLAEEGSTESGSKASLASLKFPHLKLPKNIAIDRLGLQATRIQLETLLDDLRVRDEYIAKVEDELLTMRRTVNTTQTEAILKLSKQVEEYMSITAALKKEKEALLYKTRFVKEDLLAQLHDKIETIDVTTHKEFTKLTAAARGFLSRRRVNRLKLFKLADETGVLVAMSNTIQGESGWYVGPHGSIFYFVLKDGKWILTAGPLTEQDFRVTYMQLSAGNHKNVAPGKLLTKCAFNLAGDHGEIFNQGHLYVSNGNGKLFIAMPVDEIIADMSQEQQFNDQELPSSLISFNSSLASKYDDSVDSLDGESLSK